MIGLKATSTIMNGFRLRVTDFKIEGIKPDEEQLIKLYENMPIEVKITTKSVQTIIEVKTSEEITHS